MIPRLVHEIEGGYPEHYRGAEEEGQGKGYSSKLIDAIEQYVSVYQITFLEAYFGIECLEAGQMQLIGKTKGIKER